MPYSKEFQHGQAVKTVGSMVIAESHTVTHDGSPEEVNSISFDARSFRSAEFSVGKRTLTVYVAGLVGDQATLFNGGYEWSFGMADLLEAVAAAQKDA